MSQDETVEDFITKSPPSLPPTGSDETGTIAAANTDEVPSVSQLSLDTSAPDLTNAAAEEHGATKGVEEKQVHPSEEKPEGQMECVDSVSLDPDVTQEEEQGAEVHLIGLICVCAVLQNLNNIFFCVFCGCSSPVWMCVISPWMSLNLKDGVVGVPGGSHF